MVPLLHVRVRVLLIALAVSGVSFYLEEIAADGLWQKAVNFLWGDAFFRRPEIHELLRGDTLEKRRKIFQEGYGFYQGGEHAKARVFFLRALNVYPQLRDYQLYFLGRIESTTRDFNEAVRHFSELQTLHPQSVWFPSVTLELGKIAYFQKDYDKSIGLLGTLQAKKTDVSFEASLYLARAWLAKGDSQRAYSIYKALRSQPLSAPLRREVKAEIQKLRVNFPATFQLSSDSSLLEEASLLIRERDYQSAETLLKDLLQRASLDGTGGEAMLALARSYQLQRRREEEISVLQRIASDETSSIRAPRAMYRLAQILWNLDQNERAIRLLMDLKRRFPADLLQGDVLYMLGRIHQDMKNSEAAVHFYRELTARFPENRFCEEAAWRIGWIRYVDGKPEKAGREFEKALRTASDAFRESFLYWLGRSLEQSGKKGQAKRAYLRFRELGPESYYGFLAAERLSRLRVSPGQISGSVLRDTSSKTAPQDFPPEVVFHLQRSRELRDLNMSQFSQIELEAIRASAAMNLDVGMVLLDEYRKDRLIGKGIQVADELLLTQRSKGAESLLRSFAYPLGFFDLISGVATDRKLDPYLIAAVIRQESLFDPAATSVANAQGLMQILPATGMRFVPLEQRGELKERGFYEPALNVKIGTAYLQELLQLYHGDLSRALAAYNAGEKAVSRWDRILPQASSEVFVENIGYAETRQYVKLVLRNYARYKQLYGKAG